LNRLPATAEANDADLHVVLGLAAISCRCKASLVRLTGVNCPQIEGGRLMAVFHDITPADRERIRAGTRVLQPAPGFTVAVVCFRRHTWHTLRMAR